MCGVSGADGSETGKVERTPVSFVGCGDTGSDSGDLGVYSAGIFLIHNFIRTNWLNDFTYSFGYPALIVLVLLADSLVASILIEKLKKVLHFDRFLNRIIGWIR